MAIPAFQKVRTNSQDKAVLNNARQLSAGADQYLPRERRLNGHPHRPDWADVLRQGAQLGRERGVSAGFSQGTTITIGSIAGVRTITYSP